MSWTSHWTDGYGIRANGIFDFQIYNNTITPINGRGILFDGTGGGTTANGTVHDNYVTSTEGPNLEYGQTAMESTALRVRNYSRFTIKNVRFYNNTFIATTGPGLNWAAAGARITEDNSNGTMTGANLVFDGNLFKGIVTAPDPDLSGVFASTAWGLTISGVGAGTGIVLKNNVLESNAVSLHIGDNDSGSIPNQDMTFLNNTIKKSNDGAAMTYHAIVAGDFNSPSSNIRLINMKYTNGAKAGDVVLTGSRSQSLWFGWTLNVTVTNAARNLLSGVPVTITNDDGSFSYVGVTGANGTLGPVIVLTTNIFNTNGGGATTRTKNNLTIRATTGSLTGSATVVMTDETSTTIVVQ